VEDEKEEEEGGKDADRDQDVSMIIRTQLIQTLPAFLNSCIQLRIALKKT
jgi:hypothetical protein